MATPKNGTSGTLGTDLVGFYSFDGGYTDGSGEGNDLTAQGSPTATTDKDGNNNSAYLFQCDTQDDYFEVTNALSSAGGSDERTISLWYQCTGLSSRKSIFVSADIFNMGGESLDIEVDSTGELIIWVDSDYRATTFTLGSGWYNIVLILKDSNTLVVSVNDVQETLTSISWDLLGNKLFIGAGYYKDDQQVKLDEIRLYTKALTLTQVTEIYNLGVNDILPVIIITPTPSATSISCSWTAVAEVDTYTLRYKKTSEGTFTTVTGIGTNSYNILGLDSETEYDIEVDALNGSSVIIGEGTTTATTTKVYVPLHKLQEFIVLIAGLMERTIIASKQGRILPAYPFITYQSINSDRNNLDIINSELIENNMDIRETKIRRVENVIQFDIYNTGINNVNSEASNLVDSIDFIFRRQILSAGFGIVNIGDITDNTSLEQVKTRFRKTVEITIDYTEENERIIENLQSIEYELDGEDAETVSRE